MIIKKDSVSGVGPGIIMPALQNRWRVVFNSSLPLIDTKSDSNIISMSVVRCKVNYKTKIANLEIEQNISGDLHEILQNLITLNSFKFRLDVLSGGGDICHSTEFINSIIKDHEINYDYALGGVLTHTLEISYKHLRVLVENKT